MMSSTIAASCDVCGWLAAFGGMVAFGSFGVPIKSRVARSVDIDPLVMQTYKTAVCFATSWLVLLWGEPFSYTPWGIVSGLFWVPGGIATVFAIKNAGLAIALGISASLIVLVSFTWGIFVFEEHVHSRLEACLAVLCMLCGLVGMAYFSAPSVAHGSVIPTTAEAGPQGEILVTRSSTYQEVQIQDAEVPDDNDDSVRVRPKRFLDDIHETPAPSGVFDVELSPDDRGDGTAFEDDDVTTEVRRETSHVWCFGCQWRRRDLGVLAAVFNGIYGGSIMVPMKWAPTSATGAPYVISFAIGASIVTFGLWVGRYTYLCQRHCSFSRAYASLPSFHVRKMWFHGGLCGLLWSIGNFFSIVSVQYLGEGVGYSVIQANMLISGAWGILLFREIEGGWTICKWFISAVVAVVGILLLSYEHHTV
jgi:glucose uptake protein GlcU